MNRITAARESNRRTLLVGSAAAVALGLVAQPASAGDRSGRESRNKRRVAKAFRDAAERGTLNRDNNFYLDILAEDAVWTVASVPSRIYRDRQDFITRGSAPILDRLSTPIYPTVKGLYADGDTVVVVWDGTATALDGKPYANSYTWIFTMRGSQAISAVAFLDLVVINELVERVQPATPNSLRGKGGRTGGEQE